jgi:GNAT superfamily N-acetyltransferase
VTPGGCGQNNEVPASARRRDWVGPADLPGLIRFAQRTWTPDGRWHIGDFAWEFGLEPAGRPSWHRSLWERDGDVVAWAWLAEPDRLSVAVDPAHVELFDAVLAWASSVAGVRVCVTVLSTEHLLTEALVRMGYAPDEAGHFFVAHHRTLDDIPLIPLLPAGFRVRPVRGDEEVSARAALHREVWASTDLTEDVCRTMTRQWPYSFDFDWVAEAPDGRLVSYVLGWYDDVNRVGEFEPVGTLAAFRRFGLSRAVGIAVLHAFRASGGTQAMVYARGDDDYPVARQVYTALGFRPRGRTVTYRPPA